jgi:hypothetical protein
MDKDVESLTHYLELLKEIRRYWPDTREKCPAIVLSGSDLINDKCLSEVNNTGECTRNACPILWE